MIVISELIYYIRVYEIMSFYTICHCYVIDVNFDVVSNQRREYDERKNGGQLMVT